MGLPAHNSLSPCIYCHANLENLFEFSHFTSLDCGFREAEYIDYDTACRKCEIWVHVTKPLYSEIIKVLFADDRDSGSKGRSLKFSLRCGTLLAGDRLEPCENLPDV